MIKVEVRELRNGFIVTIDNSIRRNGEYLFKNTEELQMLEFLGEVVLDKKINVTVK